MLIAIDTRELSDPQVGSGAGVSHYIWGIVRALLKQGQEHTFLIFLDPSIRKDSIEVLLKDGKYVEIQQINTHQYPFFSNHFLFPQYIKQFHPDIFFAPGGQIPLGYNGKSVVTIHDLAIFKHASWFKDKCLGKWFSTHIFVPKTLYKATCLFAVSQATKQDLQKIFRIPEEKIKVVYPGVNTPISIESTVSEKTYFLCLGTLEPRKNFILAVQAFDRLLKKYPELEGSLRLIIAGKRGWKYKELLQTIDTVNKKYTNQKDCVIQELGYISFEKKWSLLKNAIGFIFPSFYEGFGLPVLEAMSLGVPVITTNNGALKEVGQDAVIYVSGEDIDELAKAMQDLLVNQELRESLSALGKKQSEKFSWQQSAEVLLFEFKRIYNQD
ncbi:hypothetical protein CO172_00455 [Candidatus Uhrbacteria bacterium CG_4_9_14_3_um_filter_36_7]|uniref:Glycosyltransferase family 1 protein n=1 Tax=Candidatus Uhrbacteria bacterium CG_4_9_14_3_um_filter_36_7 TaxID=1975033 RepID=A0A2M7XIE8_9BACT|nr:MAG: hypothetical protein CO172_00455 [Candidatus Uhrbacteria bacterium CG_4_9_14_3_um_filter_36_7]